MNLFVNDQFNSFGFFYSYFLNMETYICSYYFCSSCYSYCHYESYYYTSWRLYRQHHSVTMIVTVNYSYYLAPACLRRLAYELLKCFQVFSMNELINLNCYVSFFAQYISCFILYFDQDQILRFNYFQR